MGTLTEDLGQANMEKIVSFYNVSINEWDDNLVEIAGNILTDYMFRCPSRNMIISSTKHASTEANIGFFYHFNYLASYVEHVWFYKPACWTHVCHTEELPLVFNPNASDAKELNTKWMSFGLDSTLQQTLMINDVGRDGVVMSNAPDANICDFWDSLGYDWLNGPEQTIKQ